jgi:starch synthase
MKVAFISSEVFPYSKTGGLADVSGSLPAALEKLGCEIKIFTPKYSTIDEDKFGLRYNWNVGEMPIRISDHIRMVHLHQSIHPDSNVEVNFIDCPTYFFRGRIYTNDSDEDQRFILLCKGAIEIMQRLKWVPDIIHCNDWQTGILPLLLKDNYSWDQMFNDTATVYTIHNIGYQGRFSTDALFNAEIRNEFYYPGGPVEFENSVSFMKTAILFSDIINTVSKTYSYEILTPEYGAGMDKYLIQRKDDLFGILNGVDYSIWNPETDKHLPYKYVIDDLSGKLKNKKFLLEHFKLQFDENIPLIGIISRLAGQKGFDIVETAIKELMEINAQWIILGSGEEKYETVFRYAAQTYPEKAAVYIGYNNELAHLIEAGSDMFLMPSHYEPCGLNQMYSLKYGTVPIVRKTGGLADTVQDWHEYLSYGEEAGTGFSFNDYTSYALVSSVQRAVDVFKDKDVWSKIQVNGMKKDYSWEASAKEYLVLYRKAIEKRTAKI